MQSLSDGYFYDEYTILIIVALAIYIRNKHIILQIRLGLVKPCKICTNFSLSNLITLFLNIVF